jgi:hypothetical protein
MMTLNSDRRCCTRLPFSIVLTTRLWGRPKGERLIRRPGLPLSRGPREAGPLIGGDPPCLPLRVPGRPSCRAVAKPCAGDL